MIKKIKITEDKAIDMNLKALIEIERVQKEEDFIKAGDTEQAAIMYFVVSMSQKGAERVTFEDFVESTSIEEIEAFANGLSAEGK